MYKVYNNSDDVIVRANNGDIVVTGASVTLRFGSIQIYVSSSKHTAHARLERKCGVELLDAYFIENYVGTLITVIVLKTFNGTWHIPLHSDVMIEGLIFSGEKSDYSSSPNEEEDDED